MEHAPIEWGPLAWFAGWAIALAALFFAGLQLPLQTRLTRGKALLYNGAVIAAAIAIAVLASTALILHDLHIDLTREKVYTPSRQAMTVVDRLQQPVRLTYFYNGQDANGRRMRDVLDVMGKRNALLEVRTVDPDRQPAIARAYGVQMSNAAILEAEGRKVVVQTTDEA